MKDASEISYWIYQELGSRIAHRRRKELGLTQKRVATAAGIDRTSLAKIEAGTQKIAIDTLFAIAEVLRVEPITFLPGLFDRPSSAEFVDKAILRNAQALEGIDNDEIDSIARSISNAKLNEKEKDAS